MEDGAAQGKAALRKGLLAQRNGLKRDHHETWSRAVAERVEALPEYKAAKNVVFYASKGNEVDTRKLMERAMAAGKKCSLPAVDDVVHRLIMYRVEALEPLRPGYKGILEPERREVSKDEAELVFVPGLAFDANGTRLGMGGGFYDRYLAGLREQKSKATLVGLAFDFQVVEVVPSEAHDERVHVVVTPTRLLDARTSR